MAARKLPAGGKFCRAVYALLTNADAPCALRKAVAMRINGPHGTSYGAPTQGTRRAGSSTFSLPTPSEAPDTRAASAPKAPNTIDALLAMQSVNEDPAERRRRSVQRGRGALDLLDELKMAMLAGAPNPSALLRLRAAAADLKTASGDAGLDAVLSEIDLRVEVEIAKASRG
jgi:hypothetical protein